MALKLSVTDPLQNYGSASPSARLSLSTRLAQACEEWGYHRFWISEHHETAGYGISCPEILIAHLASITSRVRVGIGGIMLSHHSPFQVAETYRMLATLHPDRIDLGVGRAPGADAPGSQSLVFPAAACGPEFYTRQSIRLTGFLNGYLDADHPASSLRLMPAGGASPQQWMLGTGEGSAQFAAQLGANFALVSYDQTGEHSLSIIQEYKQAYREAGHEGEPLAMLAAAVICADSDEQAELLAHAHAKARLMNYRSATSERAGSAQLASDNGTNSSLCSKEFENILSTIVRGSASQCREKLEALASSHTVDEITVVNVIANPAASLRSFQLLAESVRLSPGN